MKLTILFLTICILNVSAHTTAQSITISGKNMPLKKVFGIIKKQTGYVVFTSESVLSEAKPVSVSVTNMALIDFLELTFKDQPLTYKIADKTIIVSKKDAERTLLMDMQAHVLISEPPPPIDVTIVVKNLEGQSLEGASIRVKGSRRGISTDANGMATLKAIAPGAILVISFTGYRDSEVKVDNTTSTINVKLTALPQNLDDIVVVGYATQKKATLTGAVEQVTAKTFESRAVTNAGLALQGATPGLVVTRTSPRPGNENLALLIRGVTSVNGGSPLVIIDGVPTVWAGNFLNMNSDDIESISVIKDGATAIYGSQGANGVILVTTKRGSGKLKIDYTGNFRYATNGIETFSPTMQEYAKLWIAGVNEETSTYANNFWMWANMSNLQDMAAGKAQVYTTKYVGDVFMAPANRINELFAPQASYQHNISISSRNDKTGYRISLQYANNKDNLAVAYDGQKQWNANFNYDYKFSNWSKLETGITFQDVKTSSPSTGIDATMFVWDMPFFPAKNPYGEWNGNFGSVGDRNSAGSMSAGGRDDQNGTTGKLNNKLTFQLTKDISVEGIASLQGDFLTHEKYITPVKVYDWYGIPTTAVYLANTQQSASNPGYQKWTSTSYYQYYSAFVKYNKTFAGKHSLAAQAGIVTDKYHIDNLWASRTYFADNGVYDLNLAANTNMYNSGGKDQWGTFSYVGRVNYNYSEKYLFEIQGRRDGNSRFADGFKFQNYGGASAGWVFTKEDMLQSIANIVNFGKLRFSYGSSGNYAGIGTFDYLTSVSYSTLPFGTTPANQTTATLGNNGLVSPGTTWERVTQKNAGIDLGFLHNRLSTTFDYFIKDNIGMLSALTYPAYLGGTPPVTNSGTLHTKGWEITLAWKDNIGKLNYNIGFNLSNTTNLVTKYYGSNTWISGLNNIVEGYPYKSWFLFQTAGFFKDQKDVNDYYAKYGTGGLMSTVPQGDVAAGLRPGDTKRVDVNGDGTISDTWDATSKLHSDAKYMGDASPHFVFGINLSASYKGFDLTAFFQGVWKQNVMRNGGWVDYPFENIWTNQNVSYLGKTWTAANTGAKYPRLKTDQTNNNLPAWDWKNNDFMLQNARYIRLKSLVLGYTIPEKLIRKTHLSRLRVYFSGNDLWEYTSIKDNYDPEMGFSEVSPFPFTRTRSLGVNVGF
jgi:TonB-linked SusC/RagA family outer membrane protein